MIEAIDRADAYRREQFICDVRAASADKDELAKYLGQFRRDGL